MPPDDPDEGEEPTTGAEHGEPDEGPVLDPNELDFSRDRRVAAIDENRYVVSPTDERPNVPDTVPSPPSRDATTEETDSTAVGPQDPAAMRRDLAAAVAASEHDYAFEAIAQFEDGVRHERAESNDVTEMFEAVLTWYANGTSEETPRRDVVGILLAESDLPVRLPASAVERAVRSSGVGPDDSVADLLAAVRENGGLELDDGNQD